MIVFETILVMLASAVLLVALARRFKLPYPVLLALAGAAVAVAQVDVGLHLNPELALALFIAPVLLDAAYDTSLRDLKRHWGPVASLVVIAVGLTTFAVALVVHALVPSIPWAVQNSNTHKCTVATTKPSETTKTVVLVGDGTAYASKKEASAALGTIDACKAI